MLVLLVLLVLLQGFVGPCLATESTVDSTVRLAPFDQPLFYGRLDVEADVEDPESKVARVVFSVDGDEQVSLVHPPWRARLNLPSLPDPIAVVVESFDSAGTILGRDRQVLNAGLGNFRVTVQSPAVLALGDNRIVLDVDVPAAEPPPEVTLSLDGRRLATLTEPPYEARVNIERLTAAGNKGRPLVLSVRAVRENGEQVDTAMVLGDRQRVGFQEAVSMVELFVVAKGRRGVFVSDLAMSEMSVREGAQDVAVRRFVPASEVRLTVALAIDVSTSMRDQLDRVTEAALHFTDNLRPLDRALLVTFASQPELLHPPTNNRDALRSALDSLSTPSGKTRSRRGGGTALWDSLVFSLVQLGGIEGRKAVVLLTDGKDSRSQLALHQAAQFVKLSGVPVYLVDLDEIDLAAESGRRRGEGMRARQMVESSGGRLIRVEDDEELGQVYGRIAEELRQQYLLAYVAPGGDPGWRPIQLSVGRSGVVLRAAKGRWQR